MNKVQIEKKRANLVYDVGMHKGEDTDFYLKKGFFVIGFEADPDLAEYCRIRFTKEIADGRLIIVEGAITDAPPGESGDRKVRFYKNTSCSIWGTVAVDWALRNEFLGTLNDIIEVPIVDFSFCLKHYGIPHFMKIDIEGMDTVCLESLKQFIQKPDYISIESEKVDFRKLLDELNLLYALGYSRFKAIQQNGISKQREPNPSKEGHYAGYRFQENASGLFGADLPGAWKDLKGIIQKYKNVFVQYRLFGDNGKLCRTFFGKVLIKTLKTVLRIPLPGWYDTHAKHSSVVG